MRTCEQLIRALREGAYDHIFKALYAPDGNEAAMLRAKNRAVSVVESFGTRFSAAADVALFSSPGRTGHDRADGRCDCRRSPYAPGC